MRSRVPLASDGFVHKYIAYGKSKWPPLRLCACAQLETNLFLTLKFLFLTETRQTLTITITLRYLSHEFEENSVKHRENMITHT